MDLDSVQRAYRRYAPHYDRLFGRVFAAGRREAVRVAGAGAARRVLEVGVGTGLSLPLYPATCRVVGVDVSADMLAVARRRSAALGLRHVEALLEMNAEALELPDASFDAVVAMYVATVVPDPGRLLAEMARVCAPGGDLVLVSHFSSERPVLRALENALSPVSRFVGFRTGLPLDAVPQPAGVRRVAVRRINPLGLWRIVHLRRVAEGTAAMHAAERSPPTGTRATPVAEVATP